MEVITIFTPTYNRIDTLHKLYESLLIQTNKDFIWLIVDDGSTDDTEKFISNCINENKIKIEYYKQENSGKSIAHNKGVELTKTELFTCVDSDDYLDKNAVEEILIAKKNMNNCIGILCGRKKNNEKKITVMPDKSILTTTLKDAYDKYNLKGDTMLIFKSEILKMYKFPYFENEKFVPEAYLYDLLDQMGELLVLNKYLYYCEYLEGGYTKNMAKLILNNNQGYIAYINQRLLLDKTLKLKVLDTIRYMGLCIAVSKKNIIRNSVYPIITIGTYFFGYLFYIKRYRCIIKK